jgi:hypothetical protein
MRICKTQSKYLDANGLIALWREELPTQKILWGEAQSFLNHPQLFRFKKTSDSNPFVPTNAASEALFVDLDPH